TPGDVYYIPVTVPKLAANTRGSLSSDFKPVVDKRHDQRVIPYDMQRFRLTTGAPIYIDFKSMPYGDTEVLEWYRRILNAQRLQEELREGKQAQAISRLRGLGVTHLVLPTQQRVEGAGVEKVYQDEIYQVYHLTAPP